MGERRHSSRLPPGVWRWRQGIKPESGGKVTIPGFRVSDLRPRSRRKMVSE